MKTRSKYVAGRAQLDFKIENDWSREEAIELYNKASHEAECDVIRYSDCIDGMNSLPDNSIDLVIADPPFGINFSGKQKQYHRDPRLIEPGYVEINNDYDKFSTKWVECLPRIMKNTASAYIFSGWTNLIHILNAINDAGLVLINDIIWKYQFGVFTKKQFVTSHYHVLLVVKDEKNYFFNKYEYYTEDVWDIKRTYLKGQRKNGTKLPEKLVMRCINFSSKPGDIILDPFIGNGTTAICARGLYRHYHGFEINAKMKQIHEYNLNTCELGELYRPLKDFLPTTKELLKKYPHLKKYVMKKGLTSYL